jgi:hypothetical protein
MTTFRWKMWDGGLDREAATLRRVRANAAPINPRPTAPALPRQDCSPGLACQAGTYL